MPIADPKYFTKEHIESVRFGTSAQLAEQAIHCLELVSSLSKAGLSYQFKGGNSLLLILDEPKRFSIDIDIATDEPRERIEECLDAIVGGDSAFTRWDKRQHKTKPWLPIASYYLYYNALFPPEGEEPNIMLDVQLRRSPYRCEFKAVVCGDIYASDEKVELPVPGSIMGDKLLTMGPYTLGIPLGKGKEAQRLKHVCDVSTLLGTGPSLDDIRKSMFACMEHENSIQEDTMTADQVMQDTLAFCGTVAFTSDKPVIKGNMSPVLKENVLGIDGFAGHLFAKSYTWQQLQMDMARVALVMAAVCTERVDDAALAAALNGSGASPTSVCGNLLCADEITELWNRVCDWLGRDPLAELKPEEHR